MIGIAEHVNRVTAPALPNRAARRRMQQAQARAARTVHRGQVRIQKALAAYPKESAA
ncbi:hypothetical protein [Microbacterium hydrocarbonoxydans]|uniref:hypothetical protein n=1 Tax=Microbacterium hydrocarbonoxydans TaxID=273678 RepID=UPI003D9699FB